MKRTLKVLTTDWPIAQSAGLLILRLVFGLVLLFGHGYEKLTTVLSGQEIQFMDPIGIGAGTSYYLAAFAEGICAILLILGLFSRIAALVLSINFLIVFIYHAFIAGDGFVVLELRFFYLFSFIALTLIGPGRFSLDNLLFNSRYRTQTLKS